MKKVILALGNRFFFFHWLLLLVNYARQPNSGQNIPLLIRYLFFKPCYTIHLFVAQYFYPIGEFFKRIAKGFASSYFVQYPMPSGVSEKDRSLFNSIFRLYPPLPMHNVSGNYIFIDTYNGIVANFKGFNNQSYNSVWGNRAQEIYTPYPKMVYEALFDAVAGNKVYHQQAEKVYIVHHWFNYYHWFTETLTRIAELEKLATEVVILLPAQLANYTYVQQTLPLFTYIKVEWVPNGKTIVKLHNAEVVECKRSCDDYHPGFFRQLRQMYLSHIAQNNIVDITDLPIADKILILRKKVTRRNIINEAEVVEMAAKYGFTAIDFEDYTLPQQVYIISKARVLAGLHGAGLTNMVFMPANSTVLELQRETSPNDPMFSTVYYTMANALGYTYYIQFCKAEEGKNFFDANYMVDTVVLEENLKLIHK